MDLGNVFVREIQRNDNVSLKIYQCEIGDVGCVVWDAAIVLSKYLETTDFQKGKSWHDKCVVELGAGTGLVGLMAASFGARVTVTDLEQFIPLLQMNIEANKQHFIQHVEAKTLKWGSDIGSDYPEVEIILAADCIYYEESLEPLVKTMYDLCNERTSVYCCFEERTTGNKPELQRKFMNLVQQQFSIEKIPLHQQDEHYHSDDIHILKFMKLKSQASLNC